MKLNIKELTEKVRIAIDEIVGERDDDFSKDADTEIAQALHHAATEVMMTFPDEMLVPKSADVSIYNNGKETDHISNSDGSGYVVLPDDFLRLTEFKLHSWSTPVRELMEPTSDESKRQGSRWGRGTPQKPKALLSADSLGNRVLRYWTAGHYADRAKYGDVYDHEVERLLYIPDVDVDIDTITISVKGTAEKAIIYMGAGIFLEGKKEPALAERMYALAGVTAKE